MPQPEQAQGNGSAAPLLAGFSGVESENLAVDEKLKIAIVGEIHAGKSWFAATAPKPIYDFDFDGRAASLAGKSGIKIKEKATWKDVEQTLSIAKANVLQGKAHLNPQTWLFDSVNFLSRAIEDEFFNQNAGTFRILKVGSQALRIRSGWDGVNAVQRALDYLIAEFSPLGNVILVYHERKEKDVATSTESVTRYTGDVTVDPQYLAKTLSLLNDVFRIFIDYNGRYRVNCKPIQTFNCGTSMLLDKEEDPDLEAMIAKHKRRLINPQSK